MNSEMTNDGPDLITTLKEENERLRSALKRAHTVLGYMAMETPGAFFRRWPINHEPLRADAKKLLPIIEEALA